MIELLIQLVGVLIVGGLIWALVNYLPLPPPVKMAISAIGVLILIVLVCQVFGVFDGVSFRNMRVFR